jgi:tetraacyldisaccharide 4'-kinase
MTEKDAVKCSRFAGPEHWFEPIEAELPAVFGHRLLELLKRNSHG